MDKRQDFCQGLYIRRGMTKYNIAKFFCFFYGIKQEFHVSSQVILSLLSSKYGTEFIESDNTFKG